MCRPIPPGSPRRSRPGMRSSSKRRRTRGACPCAPSAPPPNGSPTNRGALLAAQPVIGLERIGDAPVRDFGRAARPFDGIRVLSFTHAVAGPTVGRTLAEQGADVLGATRPNDYEHEFIYAEANVGARSAYVDLDSSGGTGARGARCWPRPTSWSTITGPARSSGAASMPRGTGGSLPRRRLRLGQLLRLERAVGRPGRLRHERIGRFGPHDHRGEPVRAQAARHRTPERLHHRLHRRRRCERRPAQAGDRGRLVARDRQPDEDRHVVPLPRARRSRAGGERRGAQPARTRPLRRAQRLRGGPHARSTRALLARRRPRGPTRFWSRGEQARPNGGDDRDRRYRRLRFGLFDFSACSIF